VGEIERANLLRLTSAEEVRKSGCRPCPLCKPRSVEELEVLPDGDKVLTGRDDESLTPERWVKARLEFIEDVSVPGNLPWVDTHIRIQPGQIVRFAASGRVQTTDKVEEGKPAPLWGPDGATIGGQPKYCLAARVGEERVVIGRTRGVRFQRGGLLQLGFVDDAAAYADNQGAFLVRVQVWTPEGTPRTLPGKEEDGKSSGEGAAAPTGFWDGFRR